VRDETVWPVRGHELLQTRPAGLQLLHVRSGLLVLPNRLHMHCIRTGVGNGARRHPPDPPRIILSPARPKLICLTLPCLSLDRTRSACPK
jgi:hypothetical protein